MNSITTHNHQSPPPSPSSSSSSVVRSNSNPQSRSHPPQLALGTHRPNSHYHSDPIPQSPPPHHSQAQSIAPVSSPTNVNLLNKRLFQSPPRTNSTSSIPPLPKTNSGSTVDRTPIQFNTSEIERSFQALLKKQPVATPGPAVLQGKGNNSHVAHRGHLHPEDKPDDFLLSGSLSSSSTKQHQLQQPLSGNVSALSHSPVFGSPATDHARHWIRSVNGRDHFSDSESEQRESDQDLLEDNHQQWQVDYDHHIAGHVELETETGVKTPESEAWASINTANGRTVPTGSTHKLEAPSSPVSSSWTGNVHPMFSMADPMGSREQGLISPTATRPSFRTKDSYAIHPLSPVPPSPASGRATPTVVQTRSPEMRPQVVFHPSDLSPLNLASVPLASSAVVYQPLPPVPGLPPTSIRTPSPTTQDSARNRYKQSRSGSSHRIRNSPLTAAQPIIEKKPVSLTNPPRKCIHHGKILQVINTSTVKDRYLFLFSDLMLIAKPMSDGHPSLDSRFQVKDIIELKKISLSLSRDKFDPKNGEQGSTGNRRIPPILAEFIHTFDQNPTRALNSFIQKRALHPDPASVAHLLFKTPELSKTQLALFFSNPANRHVYRAFLDQCQFAGVLLDDALRSVLNRLSLPDRDSARGSGDKAINAVDYLLEEFTKRWYEANVNVVVFDASIAHKLVIAMLVLNAQLHSNEGATLVKGREEVGILVRPRVSSQPSTPTIPSTPTMETLSPNATVQYLAMDLDDLTVFPSPTKDSFVESFQLLDQQRIVPRDTLQNIFSCICHQPLDIETEKDTYQTASTSRKLWPIMVSPASLPPRLTLKIPSDPITITVPILNPHFSIHLGGRDLKCEPSVLEFGSHRSQRFRITGAVPGRKTLTIHARLSDKGTPEQYYDLQSLPTKHTIAVERQFMRHTFQISLLNDLGTRRRYLFGTSSAAEKDDWARVLAECLSEAKGQNAVRLNEHTGLEQSIGLQILKELLLGVEGSDQEVPPEAEMVPILPPLGLGIPMESPSGPNISGANSSPTLTGVSMEWVVNNPSIHKEAWMCKMPKAGSAIQDRHGWELVKLVEQNSLIALMLGFMGALGRDRLRRDAVRKQEEEARVVGSEEGYDDDGDYIYDEDYDSEEEQYGEFETEHYVLETYPNGRSHSLPILEVTAPTLQERTLEQDLNRGALPDPAFQEQLEDHSHTSGDLPKGLSSVVPLEDTEDGIVATVSGRVEVRKGQGKEIWWAQ
ncbi:hypothetical protein BGZ92_010039 [Podila epicladia]|nr:hypothetical protein BGZ92_010039 [Podila epicladia]